MSAPTRQSAPTPFSGKWDKRPAYVALFRPLSAFRSSFYLLPTDGICFENSGGAPIPLDFLHPEFWSRFGLSPMTAGLMEKNVSPEERQERVEEAQEAEDSRIMGASPVGIQTLGGDGKEKENPKHADLTSFTPTPDEKASCPEPGVTKSGGKSQERDEAARASDATMWAYLQTTLSNVEKFRNQLVSGYDPQKRLLYPPLVVLASKKTPTVRGCIVDSLQELQDGKYDRLLFGEGGE